MKSVTEIHGNSLFFRDRNSPFEYTLDSFAFTVRNVSQVIRGWDIGVNGMCVGETRTLTIPPYLAYGATTGTFGGQVIYGFDSDDEEVDLGDYWEDTSFIPNCATLIFDIELLNIA